MPSCFILCNEVITIMKNDKRGAMHSQNRYNKWNIRTFMKAILSYVAR